MKKFLTALVAMLFCAPVLAEDTPFVHFLGFSKDGKKMAFQETLVQDGSGFYRSAIRVLDVVSDRYVAVSKSSIDSEEEVLKVEFAKFVADAQKKAQPMLNKHKIEKNRGEVVPISVAPRISSFTSNGKYISMIINQKPVDITGERKYNPTQKLADCKSYSPESIPQPGHLNGYELTGYGFYTKDGLRELTLHSDKRIPNSRGCPVDYSLNSAMAYNGKVVVLVAVKTWGFEGPDISYITVPFNINKF